jgi:hypothetical protein
MSKFKLLAILLFVFSANIVVFSQSYNSKLLVKYDSQTLAKMEQKNNAQFELLEYFVDNGFNFIDMPDKEIQYIELEKIDPATGEVDDEYIITEADIKDFNPLEFNCIYNDMQRSYYKVGNTGKLLIIPTSSDLCNAIENKKRTNK